MEKTKTVFKCISLSMKSQPWKNFLDSRHVFPVRCYSDDSQKIQKTETNTRLKDDSQKIQKAETNTRLKIRDIFSFPPGVTFWNESAAIRRNKKRNSFFKKLDNITDFTNGLQHLRKLPITPTELYYFLKKRYVRKQILEQMYLPERHVALKADLATSHFLIRRGGTVRFVGQRDWIGKKGKPPNLPITYVPGYYIEAIDAEGTNLYYEGLSNLSSLRYLSWLSLKGLEQVNDWYLDWISNEYCSTLEHLDISDCKAVTFRGLSCFYRFDCLKTLEVSGVSDSSEFKLACIMLQDVMPELEIKGIDLSIPKKIDPVNVEEVKNIPGQ